MDFKKQGKRNRERGRKFELEVRKFFEKEPGRVIVSKWQNNVDLEKGTLVQAKSNRFMMRTTGYPDFVVYEPGISNEDIYWNEYQEKIVGVECKVNGYLNPEERKKAKWLLDNGVFSEFWVAMKTMEGIKWLRKKQEELK
jgi:hypothetical protein